MADWSSRVTSLLQVGERIESETTVGSATVVVTNRRVLAFTPEQEGAEYTTIDRPNVLGAERRSVSQYDFTRGILIAGAVGGLLAGLGVLVDPESLIPRPDVSESGAAGGAVSMVDSMLDVFYMFDTAMLAFGSVGLLIALALGGVQLATRESFVAIEVADGSDVHLPNALSDDELAAFQESLAEPNGDDAERGPSRTEETRSSTERAGDDSSVGDLDGGSTVADGRAGDDDSDGPESPFA